MTRFPEQTPPNAVSKHAGEVDEPAPAAKRERSNRGAARARNRAEARRLAADPLLCAKESAGELGIGLSTFWKYCSQGRLPAPVYPTPKAARWRMSELRAATDAMRRGAPNRKLNTTDA